MPCAPEKAHRCSAGGIVSVMLSAGCVHLSSDDEELFTDGGSSKARTTDDEEIESAAVSLLSETTAQSTKRCLRRAYVSTAPAALSTGRAPQATRRCGWTFRNAAARRQSKAGCVVEGGTVLPSVSTGLWDGSAPAEQPWSRVIGLLTMRRALGKCLREGAGCPRQTGTGRAALSAAGICPSQVRGCCEW